MLLLGWVWIREGIGFVLVTGKVLCLGLLDSGVCLAYVFWTGSRGGCEGGGQVGRVGWPPTGGARNSRGSKRRGRVVQIRIGSRIPARSHSFKAYLWLHHTRKAGRRQPHAVVALSLTAGAFAGFFVCTFLGQG